MIKNIVVIGGGAAGMMSAIAAATAMQAVNSNGGTSPQSKIILIEKNEKLGKKLYITGKGRCNLTNNTDIEGLLANTPTNSRFLNSAFRKLDSQGLMNFFENLHIPLKTERGNRVFPVSNKADDINRALEKRLRQLGVEIQCNTAVCNISVQYIDNMNNQNVASQNNSNQHAKNNVIESIDSFQASVKNDEGIHQIKAAAVIIATGGKSYPATGSTGDGCKFAETLGHTNVCTLPSLVPLKTKEDWPHRLMGLSLRNVKVTARLNSGKVVFEDTGEMLFTHNGISGPLILKASTFLTAHLPATHDFPTINIDLKPALSKEQLDARILRDFAEIKNRNFANALDALLPQNLIPVIIALSAIPSSKKVNEITRQERQDLVSILKSLPLTITDTTGFKEAVITKGGVNVKEINPSTMMSKTTAGLFFAGEVMDVDAFTGGYNLQIAFSTGHLAGISAANFLNAKIPHRNNL